MHALESKIPSALKQPGWHDNEKIGYPKAQCEKTNAELSQVWKSYHSSKGNMLKKYKETVTSR